IGLDVVRDLPVPPGTRELEEVFRTTPNLYGVGKFTQIRGDAFFERIDAPPILKAKGQVGDVSVQVDFDGILRRGNLFPSTFPSLGLLLAAKYLQKEGISEQKDLKGALKLGKVTLPIFEANDGAYVGADAGGYQILMNWYTSPQSFQQVSVSQVLEGKIAPNLFKDKIVLLGYYTISKKDLFSTPLSNLEAGKTPRQAFGVEIHANLSQYLLKTVLDSDPLLKAIPEPLEIVWISGWLCLSGALIWQFKRVKFSVVLIATGLGVALVLSLVGYEIHFWLFNWGWWLPFFSSTLGILLGSLITLFYVFREKILDHIENLEEKVKERTGELERALATVNLTQKQLIEQEKLAFLGRLTAGFCHQFKNPLYQLKYGFSTIIKSFGGDEGELTEEEKAMIIELLKELQEPIEKLELIFKLILISPAQKKVSLLEIKPNEFVNSLVQSVSKYQNKSLAIKVDKDFAPELFERMKIPQPLEIPLFNILENAFDAVSE
ncbi:MAG: CHASE2 domain-containing protein, partial [Microcystaceae cyanobacterium]